jgi:hypothetical protein
MSKFLPANLAIAVLLIASTASAGVPYHKSLGRSTIS